MNPYGENLTKRFVSKGAEELLFEPVELYESGSIELVDYMGGDGTVIDVATTGRGLEIFESYPEQHHLIEHLVASGIERPFEFVQLKFSIQAPIDTALSFIHYEPRCSVNEYSGRYSLMPETSYLPDVQRMSFELGYQGASEELRREIQRLLAGRRAKVHDVYEKLVGTGLARELARIPLGTDQDTIFWWKMDLLSLSNWVKRQKKLLTPKGISMNYVNEIDRIAERVAPDAWYALMRPTEPTKKGLRLPRDEKVIDPPLSGAPWEPQVTRRPTVKELEEVLFEATPVLDEHGAFQVTDYIGHNTAPAHAARVSYGEGTTKVSSDKRLMRTLIRDRHTSPIEMNELAWRWRAPMFVEPRQAARHRTIDGEGFMGYSALGSLVHVPEGEQLRLQHILEKQGRGDLIEEQARERAAGFFELLRVGQARDVKKLRNNGVPEHLVRTTKGVWTHTIRSRTGDLHNIGHFLRLRLDHHAQYEIREYAEVLEEALQLFSPTTHRALQDYVIQGMSLSCMEVEHLARLFKRELDELDTEEVTNYLGSRLLVGGKLGREALGLKAKLDRLKDIARREE